MLKRHVTLQQAAVDGKKLHIICKDRRTVIGVAERYEDGYVKIRHNDRVTYILFTDIDKIYNIKQKPY
ncbi:hypothetical protein E0485_17465 [Paenibacillus albiflavus]|uniref:DUF2642 domain-containing protein n=1 Tax=Paenibacillus albiflavus TaxID=2545760 RepID=A0A4V2WNG1_9BACL|nr:hypothetical protein [Paenibacillus albiflavus]TCZ75392.1 hypothetical protein E0485_17465 [Paenibacillus albiflavus]